MDDLKDYECEEFYNDMQTKNKKLDIFFKIYKKEKALSCLKDINDFGYLHDEKQERAQIYLGNSDKDLVFYADKYFADVLNEEQRQELI